MRLMERAVDWTLNLDNEHKQLGVLVGGLWGALISVGVEAPPAVTAASLVVAGLGGTALAANYIYENKVIQPTTGQIPPRQQG